MSIYRVQAGIGPYMFYERSMPLAHAGSARKAAFGDLKHMQQSGKFPNERVRLRAGSYADHRLFRPTWFRILRDWRVKDSQLPNPVYEVEREIGVCPPELLPKLVQPIPASVDLDMDVMAQVRRMLVAPTGEEERAAKARERAIWRAKQTIKEQREFIKRLKGELK
jgi:hypothetical protein